MSKFLVIFFALLVHGFPPSCSVAQAQISSNKSQNFRDVQINTNPGFENGLARYSKTAGTWALATSGTNFSGIGKASLTWNPTATGQILRTADLAIPQALKGGSCSAYFLYTGGDNLITAQVYDSNGNAISGASVLSARSTWNNPGAPSELSFICPSTGTAHVRWTSTGDAALIALDQVMVGSINSVSLTQGMELYGSVIWNSAVACDWPYQSNTPGIPGTDASCNDGVATGKLAVIEAKRPYVRLTNAPAGTYYVVATFSARRTGTASVVFWQLFDSVTGGTDASVTMSPTSSGLTIPTTLTGSFTYTASTNTGDIGIREYVGNTGDSAQIWTQDSPLKITVYRMPLSSEQPLKIGREAMRVDASITAVTADMGTVSVANYASIFTTTGVLTNNVGTGTVPAQIACTPGNASTGTTCATGNESLGIAFPIYRTGDYKVCAAFSHKINVNSTTGDLTAAFQLAETTNLSTDIVQEGKTKVISRLLAPTGGSGGMGVMHPMHLCGTFTFNSTGTKTVRLMYEQLATATVTQSNISIEEQPLTGQQNMHWTVEPIVQHGPQMLVTNSISTLSNNGIRFESALVQSGSAVETGGSDWLAGCGTYSGGGLICTINAGVFATTPDCVATPRGGSGAVANIASSSATSLTLACMDINGAACSSPMSLHCAGPR